MFTTKQLEAAERSVTRWTVIHEAFQSRKMTSEARKARKELDAMIALRNRIADALAAQGGIAA